MDEIRIKAKQDYMQGMKYKDICDKHNVSMNTLKSWVKRYGWSEERKNLKASKKKGAPKDKRGAPLNNDNAVGHGAPKGNLNSVKHGAHQSIYEDMLKTEDKILFNMIQASTNIDDEIKLLRLKIARLLNREKDFFYNDYGTKVEKEISEEDRLVGINACMDQLRKLISDKAKMANDTEKLRIAQEKLALDKTKIIGADEEVEDDGFLDALNFKMDETWGDCHEED